MYSNAIRLLSHAVRWCLVAGMIVSWSVVSDAQCVVFFDDEAQFLANTPTPDLESFETLTPDNAFVTDQIVTPGFTMDFAGVNRAGVFDVPVSPTYATHGTQHVAYLAGDPSELTFTFNTPINALGFTLTDVAYPNAGTMTFMNNAGDVATVAMGPLPIGNQLFFGVVNYEFDFTMVILSLDDPMDGYGIDGIYSDFINLPSTTAIACKDVNLSLNEDCEALVVPAMALSGFYPCYDNFIVELSYHGHPVPNPITLEYVGKYVTATVTDTASGNSCWSQVYIEDKFAPEVLCQDDTVNCIVYNMYYDTPSVVEHCLEYELMKLDETIETLSCDSNYIKRITQVFQATDEYGNVSDTCSRTIMIERFPLERVICPVMEKTLYCDDDYITDADGHPHPDLTGSPYLYNEDPSKATLYGADNQGNFFAFDIDNGTIHLITDNFNDPGMSSCPGFPGNNRGVTEIEFDPMTGFLYAKAVDGCDYGFTFDPRDGCEGDLYLTVPPNDFDFGDFQGAEVIDGIWYVSSVRRYSLDIFDPVMGTFSPIGFHGGMLSFNGLAYDGTTLYGCEARGGTGLYSIDIMTGAATLIGDMGVSLGSLEVGPDGYLYGGGGMMPYAGRLYRIDPMTAQVQQIMTTGLGTTITSLVTINEVLDLYPQPDFFCNLWVDYTDVDFGKVGCTRKIMRTWSVQEWWCTEDLERRCTQFIYIKDTLGPELYFNTDSIYATTNPGYHNCDGDVYVPWPYVEDECHNTIELDLKYPGGFVDNWQGEKIKLPVGFHTVYVTAYDSCYNSSVDSIVVHVLDKIAPIAVCDQNTVVALDNDGIVHTYAEVFDDGSFDDCHIKGMEVRRMDDPCLSGTDVWGDYVEFCCADVNTEVMVGFRVMDKSGNYGTCMVNVLVVDKLPPKVTCPPDITVDCRFDYDPNYLDVFGKMVHHDSLREPIVLTSDTLRFSGPALDGVAYDNCPMVMVDSSYFESLDNCGNGILWRYFYAVDAQDQRSHMCTQRITFVNYEPFTEDDILWPEDFDTVNVCTDIFFDPDFLPEERAYPRYPGEDECSLIGATYKDHIIDNTGGSRGCFKILRKWKVIDWCQYVNNQFIVWEHEQVILVENTVAPFINDRFCQDTVICFYTPNCTPPEITLSVIALDDCTPRDQLLYRAKIDLDNNGSFDTIREGSSTITDFFPAGEHRIKWFVEDLCGNETTCEYTFELRNCKAPLAYCKTGVILELTPMDWDGDGTPDTEMVVLWAKDLDDGSSTECQSDVVFSFSADTTDTNRAYDCDSIGNRMVTIYVTDRTTGVSSRCITMVTIQDNNNVDVCPQMSNGNITGQITTGKNDNIMAVNVKLEGSGLPDDVTGDDGMYAFGNMPFGGDYFLTPIKTDDVLNGVSTADIVQLQRYLLGKQPLVGPEQHIAADVNMTGTISASDIAEIRKVILGTAAEFSSGRSWRFIDKAYQWVDKNDPLNETFTESRAFVPFLDDESVDWMGVKLGDLNGDVDPLGLNANSTRTTSSLVAQDKYLQKGEVAEVVIRNSGDLAIEACQFTLELDESMAELIDVLPVDENINYGHLNLAIKPLGMFSFSWDNAYVNPVGDMIVVRIRARDDGFISDMMSFSDAVTRSLLSEGGEETGLNLAFAEPSDAKESIELYQNVPNPWSHATVVRFKLPIAQDVSFTVLDANGRTVWQQDGWMKQGINTISIDKKIITTTGVLYYQLKTEDKVLTKKMLVL